MRPHSQSRQKAPAPHTHTCIMGDHTAVFADHIVDIATILKQRPRQASDHVKHVGRHYGKDQQRSGQANRGDKDGRGVVSNRIRLTPAASIANDEAVLVVPTSKRGSPTRAPLARAQFSSVNHTSSSCIISQRESRSPPVAVTTTAYIRCNTGNKKKQRRKVGRGEEMQPLEIDIGTASIAQSPVPSTNHQPPTSKRHRSVVLKCGAKTGPTAAAHSARKFSTAVPRR